MEQPYHTQQKVKFTITNYDDRYTYWVVLGNEPDGPSGGTIDENGVIVTNTATSEYTVFLGKKVGETDRSKTLETVFYSTSKDLLYNYGCIDQRYNPCGDCRITLLGTGLGLVDVWVEMLVVVLGVLVSVAKAQLAQEKTSMQVTQSVTMNG